MAKIKGFAIRGLFRYLKERHPGSIPTVISDLPSETQKDLERPVISSNMYRYEIFGQLLRAIDKRFGKGDLMLCRDIGDFAAQQDISGMFKMMLSVFSPKTTLERANLVWQKYCDTGKLVVVSSDPNGTVMRMEAFPGIDEAHCNLMVGWINRFAVLTGGKNVAVKQTSCVHHGAPHCEWTGTW